MRDKLLLVVCCLVGFWVLPPFGPLYGNTRRPSSPTIFGYPLGHVLGPFRGPFIGIVYRYPMSPQAGLAGSWALRPPTGQPGPLLIELWCPQGESTTILCGGWVGTAMGHSRGPRGPSTPEIFGSFNANKKTKKKPPVTAMVGALIFTVFRF